MIVLDRTRLIAGSDFLDGPVKIFKINLLRNKLTTLAVMCARAAQFRVATTDFGVLSAFADLIFRPCRESVYKSMIFLAPALP